MPSAAVFKGYLLILGCSAAKRMSKGAAIELYDGVNFRVLRKFLNERGWPPGLVIKIVSAKHGLLDATALIETYDQPMTDAGALRMRSKLTRAVASLGAFQSIFINLGSTYRSTIDLRSLGASSLIMPLGGIGKKMRAMKRWLTSLPSQNANLRTSVSNKRSYLYLFPDWDDFVQTPFTPEHPHGQPAVKPKTKAYAHEIFRERTPYDGLLVSLAQLSVGKGVLSRLSEDAIKTGTLRRSLRLPRRLLLFGDCGAFSYASETTPPFTPERAAELYAQFGFDVGASVDHIPLSEIDVIQDERRVRRELSDYERRRRVELTVANAETFLSVCRKREYSFVPVGVIQGLSPASYARYLHDYLDMGYHHIALGGLVPRSDGEIRIICTLVREALQRHTRGKPSNIWLHLFGILRPKLQRTFRILGVSSFDSASYLRKAWLRSDQNYLGPDGRNWYSSIRIPLSTSTAMREAAAAAKMTPKGLQRMEQRCLVALDGFDGSQPATREVINSVNAYGPLLVRKGEDNHFVAKHARLLSDRPWEKCLCAFCRESGIHVVVFRGASRNKRRGLHNTWVFYHKVLHGERIPTQIVEDE